MSFVYVPKPKALEDEMVSAEDDVQSTTSSSSYDMLDETSSSSSASSRTTTPLSPLASSKLPSPVKPAEPLVVPTPEETTTRPHSVVAAVDDHPLATPYVSEEESVDRVDTASSSRSTRRTSNVVHQTPEIRVVTPGIRAETPGIRAVTPGTTAQIPTPAAVRPRKGIWYCTKRIAVFGWHRCADLSEHLLERVVRGVDAFMEDPRQEEEGREEGEERTVRRVSTEETYFRANIVLLAAVTVGYFLIRNIRELS